MIGRERITGSSHARHSWVTRDGRPASSIDRGEIAAPVSARGAAILGERRPTLHRPSPNSPRRAHRTGRDTEIPPRSSIGWEAVSAPFGFLLTPEPPSRRVGSVVAVAAVALCTLIVYPLKHVAPVVSLSVVYLPAVLVVSLTWGAWLGVATGVISAGGVQLLSTAPHRQSHDQGLQQLGRARDVPRGRRAGELGRGDHARAHARCDGAAARGRSRRGDGASAAARKQPRRGSADGRGPPRALRSS